MAKLACAVTKAKERDLVKEESKDEDEDKDEHKEVFTLGRMNTRSQTRVSRYFTATEAEEVVETAELDLMKVIKDSVDIEDDQEPEFDSSNDDDDFDQSKDRDQDVADENM